MLGVEGGGSVASRFIISCPQSPIPKAEDYFQMCPVANPMITWILGPRAQHRGFGISVPHETLCGLSFDTEKNNNLVALISYTMWQGVHVALSPWLHRFEQKHQHLVQQKQSLKK